MLKPLILCFILSLFSTASMAEIYKCKNGASTRFSTQPCVSDMPRFIPEIDEKKKERVIKERFVVPVYSAWTGGWKKVKETKLEHFFEIEYVPVKSKDGEINSFINQQTLTELPDFISVEHFAASVSDIIESICEQAVINPFDPNQQINEKVFYGRYSCTLRRDTKKGELGSYKIMRGEKSVYMLMIKWSVPIFTIVNDQIALLQNKEMQIRLQQAENYLKNEIKLCKGERCF